MRTTFDRFNKEYFLKVHCYTIVYHVIFNCGSITKSSLILEDLFCRSSGMAHFDFWSLIVDHLWRCFTDLEKLFSWSSFFWHVLLLILTSAPYLDANITSENIFRRSSIDFIIFSCGSLIIDASLFLDDFFIRFRIFPIIKCFQEVHREVSYFPYMVRKNEKSCSKIVVYTVKIVRFLVRIIFIPWDGFIICKINEKTGQIYQKSLNAYSVVVFFGRSGILLIS